MIASKITTRYAKSLLDLAIEKSRELFSSKVVKDLEKIIQPHYLGVDDISMPATPEKIWNAINNASKK